MSNQNIEIEIKLPLKNPEELTQFLNQKAKSVLQKVYQKDIYYTPTHRDFLAFQYPFEWLRLRYSQEKVLTYKHFHPENVKKTGYCDEFETQIENPEAFEVILRNLDFKQIVTVEKTRSSWLFEGVEIDIDSVTDLGFFIELEAKSNFSDFEEGKKYLFEILGKLKAEVGEEDLRGYPFQILENKGYHFGN